MNEVTAAANLVGPHFSCRSGLKAPASDVMGGSCFQA